MKKGQVYVVFDRKYKVKKNEDGVGTVDVFIYLNRTERKYISCGQCKRSEFNEYSMRKEVLSLKHHCEKVISALILFKQEMTVENFNTYFYEDEEDPNKPVDKSHLYKGVNQTQDFIAFMQKTINDEDISDGTRKHKQCTIDALKRFGQIKTFADLTPSKIAAFDKWLDDGTRGDVGKYTYHKHLRKITRMMALMDMIPSNPYAKVPIKRGKSRERKPLSEMELKRLRALPLEGKLAKARDLFVFCSYTGLAYCDMKAFVFEDHTDKVGKMYYIDGKRIKTGNVYYTPILGPAMEVLKKYNFKLPMVSNQKGNDYLHLIQAAMGLRKSMTFHVARHSFATLALSHGVPMEQLARMMGHKDLKVTQIYGKILNSTIQRQSEKMESEIL